MPKEIDKSTNNNKVKNKKKQGEVGKKNLIPTNVLTETERKELARKGGIASVKARRKKKHIKDILAYALELHPNSNVIQKVKQAFPDVDDNLLDAETVGALRQIEKFISKGDTYAWEKVMDRYYGKAKETIEQTSKNYNIPLDSFSKEQLEAIARMTPDKLNELTKEKGIKKNGE